MTTSLTQSLIAIYQKRDWYGKNPVQGDFSDVLNNQKDIKKAYQVLLSASLQERLNLLRGIDLENVHPVFSYEAAILKLECFFKENRDLSELAAKINDVCLPLLISGYLRGTYDLSLPYLNRINALLKEKTGEEIEGFCPDFYDQLRKI